MKTHAHAHTLTVATGAGVKMGVESTDVSNLPSAERRLTQTVVESQEQLSDAG